MAPPFKRKRQASHTSTGASTSNSRASQRIRFKRPALPSQPVTPRGPLHSNRNHSQTSTHHSIVDEPRNRQPRSQNVDDVGSEEAADLVVMSIDRRQKQAIGCAYYIASEERLYCLQDITHGNLDVLETLKMDVQPTNILLSLRIDIDSSESEATRYLRRSSLIEEGDELPLSYQVDIRPSQEFAYEAAKTKLVNLETIAASNASTDFLIPGVASTAEDEQDHENFGSTTRQGKLLRLSSWVDFENSIGVGCMGAILTYLQRRRAADYLPDDGDAQHAFCVRSLEMRSLQNTMFINPDTLLSLQITQPESHPNVFNQGPGSTGSKESLSLYGSFHHYARTPQGKVKLRQMFLRPSLVLEEIRERHDLVDALVRPDNLVPLQRLSKAMSRIKNIRTVMTHLHKGINGGNHKFGGFKSGVWPTLLEFAYHSIDIRDALREIQGGRHLPLVAKATDLLDARLLQSVGTSVYDVVDLDSSIEQNRTCVKRGVDENLDHIKNIYDGMDDLLSRTAIDIARKLPESVATLINVIYFPQLGYHITLPIDPHTRQPVYQGDINEDPNNGGRWERMFTTENQVYFKDARMREMDEMLGDLWNMICDLEIEISYDLAQRVLEHEETLVAISDLCGELDCMFALAQGAIQYKLVRPRMTEENVVDIKDCRHLLQEMTVPSYVTNDAYLVGGRGSNAGRERPESQAPSPSQLQNCASSSSITGQSAPSGPSMLLLTGPNYSGKSIYLKSVAHTVYLSHIGSFVPCSGDQAPTIGLTDSILTRIRTCETVSRPHSAFMMDLQQVTQALRIATRRSLIVIDEFGKGTESADGAGLAAGLFQHLLNRGDGGFLQESPKVLAATHFHEIFAMGYLTSHPQLAFAHMEIRLDRPQPGRSSKEGEEEAARRIGTTTSSHQDSHDYNTNESGRNESDTDDVSITYLYTLRPGRCTQSFGTQCAALNGIPRAVVQRASLLSDLAVKGEDLVSICAGLGPGEEEDLSTAEQVARNFLQWDIGTDVDESDQEEKEDPRMVLESLLAGTGADGVAAAATTSSIGGGGGGGSGTTRLDELGPADGGNGCTSRTTDDLETETTTTTTGMETGLELESRSQSYSYPHPHSQSQSEGRPQTESSA